MPRRSHVQTAAWPVLATSYIHSLIFSALGGFASKLRLGEDNANVYEITATRGQNAGPDASPRDSREPDSRKRYRRNGRNRDLLGRIRFSRKRPYGRVNGGYLRASGFQDVRTGIQYFLLNHHAVRKGPCLYR